MKLGVLAGGPDDETAGTMRSPDAIERYRVDVERCLGNKLVLVAEETFERFFEHVIASFDRGESPSECARTWLITLSTGSERG